MSAADLLDEVESRMASPMVTYKENVTDDMPGLVVALRTVVHLADRPNSWVSGATLLEAIESVLTDAKPPAPCEQCGHTLLDHHEDGPGQPPTACGVVTQGDRACLCRGYVSAEQLVGAA